MQFVGEEGSRSDSIPSNSKRDWGPIPALAAQEARLEPARGRELARERARVARDWHRQWVDRRLAARRRGWERCDY